MFTFTIKPINRDPLKCVRGKALKCVRGKADEFRKLILTVLIKDQKYLISLSAFRIRSCCGLLVLNTESPPYLVSFLVL